MRDTLQAGCDRAVDPCRFPLTRCCLALPPACLPRRVPALARTSRFLLKDEDALQRTGSSQIAPVSGSLY